MYFSVALVLHSLLLLFQVAKADFEKINEFAEAAVIMRNLDKAHQIKDQRKKLLDM